MSLIGYICRSLENPRVPLSHASLEDMFGEAAGDMTSFAGVGVTPDKALTYSPVWRGVFILANAVAMLPLYTYRRDADGDGKHFATEHPAYRLLLSEPNSEQTAFIFKRTMQAVAILHGNAYAYVSQRGDGTPDQLLFMLPGTCHPVRVDGVLWYVYTPANKPPRKLPADSVIHIQGPGLDGLLGFELCAKAKHSLGSGLAAQEYSGRFFANGAEPRVVIEYPQTQTLTPEAFQRLKDSWHAMHSGLENTHKTAILEQGATLKSFGIDPEKAQLIETRKFSIIDVANWLGVPPHLLGDLSKAAYASLEQENLSFYQHSLGPWLTQWQQEAQRKLTTQQERQDDSIKIEFMVQATMWMDAAARSNYYHNAKQDGWMNDDEIRACENRNPMPNGLGKTFYRPLNMVPVGQDAADASFKRDVVKMFISDGTITAAVADVAQLMTDAGLPTTGEPVTLPEPTPEPAPEPQADDDDDASRATRQLLLDATRRMLKRLAVHVRKSGADKLHEHRSVMLDAISPAVVAYCATRQVRFAAKWYVAELLDGMERIAGTSGEDRERSLKACEGDGAEAIIRAIEAQGKPS